MDDFVNAVKVEDGLRLELVFVREGPVGGADSAGAAADPRRATFI